MATAAVKVKTQECPICTEEYRDARVLECGHHFCRVCLEEIATGHPDGHVTCPTCRHITNTTGKDDISKLPKYDLLSDFVRSVNTFVTDGNNLQKKRTCTICGENYTTYVCLECSEDLCDTCCIDHKVLEEEGHKLFPLERYLFCSAHGKYGTFFCNDCEMVCCVKCTLTMHKLHSKCKLEKATEKATAHLEKVCLLIKSLNDEEQILENISEVTEKIEIQKQLANTGFSDLEAALETLLSKVKTTKKEIADRMEAELKALAMMKSDFEDLVSSKKKLKVKIDYLLKEASPHEMITRYNKLPQYNTQLRDQLLQNETASIPKLECTFTSLMDKVQELQNSLQVSYDTLTININSKREDTIKVAILLQAFNVQSSCGIVADISQKELIVRRNNHQEPITVYDYQGNKRRALGTWIAGIAGRDWQGIDIDTKRGLYVLPVAGDIMLMDKQGNKTRQFKVSNKNMHGICYNKGKDVYVTSSHSSHGGDNKVYIINAADGTLTSSFLGIASFGVASCQVNVKGAKKHVITVTGWVKHCVKVYDFQGNVLYTVGVEGPCRSTDGYLYNPWGVCIDPSGRILVGDLSTKRVVSVDGKSWETLLTVNHEARHVCYDQAEKRLFVSCYSGSTSVFSF